jgi:hypothetical protein
MPSFASVKRRLFPNAFLLILWSGGISYVRPFFPPRARKDRVPRGPRSLRNGRAEFNFLVYTISKMLNRFNYSFPFPGALDNFSMMLETISSCPDWRKVCSRW